MYRRRSLVVNGGGNTPSSLILFDEPDARLLELPRCASGVSESELESGASRFRVCFPLSFVAPGLGPYREVSAAHTSAQRQRLGTSRTHLIGCGPLHSAPLGCASRRSCLCSRRRSAPLRGSL